MRGDGVGVTVQKRAGTEVGMGNNMVDGDWTYGDGLGRVQDLWGGDDIHARAASAVSM